MFLIPRPPLASTICRSLMSLFPLPSIPECISPSSFSGVVVIDDAAGEGDHLIRLAVEQNPMVRVALQI